MKTLAIACAAVAALIVGYCAYDVATTHLHNAIAVHAERVAGLGRRHDETPGALGR